VSLLSKDNPTFAFAGDWHGNADWAEYVVPMLASGGIKHLYQLGDFGIWQGVLGEKFLNRMAKTALDNDVFVFITLGNHEYYALIKKMSLDENGWLKLPEDRYRNLFFAPRGHTWVDSGYNFVSLGGAGTIDVDMRIEGMNWWPEEELTEQDCDQTITNVLARQWDTVDFLLTHEAPEGVPLQSIYPALRDLSADVEPYCFNQRVRLRRVVDAIQPRLNIHGHWHQFSQHMLHGATQNGNPWETRVIGLAHEGSVKNIWCPTFEQIESR
jgi:hypothetical protein